MLGCEPNLQTCVSAVGLITKTYVAPNKKLALCTSTMPFPFILIYHKDGKVQYVKDPMYLCVGYELLKSLYIFMCKLLCDLVARNYFEVIPKNTQNYKND